VWAAAAAGAPPPLSRGAAAPRRQQSAALASWTWRLAITFATTAHVSSLNSSPLFISSRNAISTIAATRGAGAAAAAAIAICGRGAQGAAGGGCS
jgi:hypothetical protein